MLSPFCRRSQLLRGALRFLPPPDNSGKTPRIGPPPSSLPSPSAAHESVQRNWGERDDFDLFPFSFFPAAGAFRTQKGTKARSPAARPMAPAPLGALPELRSFAPRSVLGSPRVLRGSLFAAAASLYFCPARCSPAAPNCRAEWQCWGSRGQREHHLRFNELLHVPTAIFLHSERFCLILRP